MVPSPFASLKQALSDEGFFLLKSNGQNGRVSVCLLRPQYPSLFDDVFCRGISFLFPQQVTGCIYMLDFLLRGDADNYGKKAARTI